MSFFSARVARPGEMLHLGIKKPGHFAITGQRATGTRRNCRIRAAHLASPLQLAQAARKPEPAITHQPNSRVRGPPVEAPQLAWRNRA
jgi:hypothetical protein